MKLVFVHGWSVTSTDTYGGLPEALADPAIGGGLNIDIAHVWLGRYVSFNDLVGMPDLVTGLERALRDTLAPDGGDLPEFSCITHSTGGPVVREWIDRYYGAAGLDRLPLRHLIMLAPANHGSPLAALGKERVGRIKAFFNGVEPGAGILQWLALGSAAQWRLSRSWIDYDPAAKSFYPFVLTGQTIDTKFYDFLNSYLTEVGSDGVVRVATANMNYSMLRLTESDETVNNSLFSPAQAAVLKPDGGVRMTRAAMGLGVIPDAAHSGDRIGIMRSVTPANAATKPVVAEIVRCLGVTSAGDYARRCTDLEALTTATQAADTHSSASSYVNMVFRIMDDQGNPVNDFDLFLLAGPRFDPGQLPKGFFVDRQRNVETPNCLVYFVNYNVLSSIPSGSFGLRVVPRPSEGFAHYQPVEFRTDGTTLAQVLKPNQTLYVDVILTRHVEPNIFRFDPASQPRRSFKAVKPRG